MKYLLLCALLLSGAFFSVSAQVTGDQSAVMCPQGGTYTDGKCTWPASKKPSTTIRCESIQHGTPGPILNIPTSESSILACLNAAYPLVESYYSSLPQFCEVSFEQRANDIRIKLHRFSYSTCDTRYPEFTHYNPNPVLLSTSDLYQCPPDGLEQYDQGPYQTGEGQNYCYYPAQPESECDCANFAGDSLSTFNDLRAPVGQYTKENPPQCIQQREYAVGRDEPLTCVCQVSAQKWISSYGGFLNGVEYEVWSTLPTTQGQPSGTFTGVKCGEKDGGPLEPEEDAPKDCFTLKNGVKWCWADKAEKCQVVNGVEQCASGCGTVNGDFVCYDDTPVIPPKDRDDLTPPDDTLTDPNKSINDMVKGDFKEVNKGVEGRLDNVITSISNSTIAMDEVSDKVGLTNSKLDGIGMQLDGVGKQLGDIDGTLDGTAEDIGDIKGILEGALGKGGKGGGQGTPDKGVGDCTENCSWYESAYPDGIIGIWNEHSEGLKQTPMMEFLNQFSTIAPSGAQPDFTICFDLGAMGNFGCKAIEIPQVIWAFIKLVMLITAAFLCRALIFGG